MTVDFIVQTGVPISECGPHVKSQILKLKISRSCRIFFINLSEISWMTSYIRPLLCKFLYTCYLWRQDHPLVMFVAIVKKFGHEEKDCRKK